MVSKEPIQPKQNLTQKVVAQLRQRIANGDLTPGDKLPTELKLVEEFGVSRTVVREAISGLKIDGLLVSRQGAGVFVLKSDSSKSTLTLLTENPKTIPSVIEALELRSAVEVGAAGLAATRCSPAQQAEIYVKYSDFKRQVRRAELSEAEDFAFHVAIAEASNNRRFVDFLTLLGRNTIPRSQLRVEANLPLDSAVEEEILMEHKDIMEAIENKDSAAAREAMDVHLTNGVERYRSLARIVQIVYR